MGVNYQTKSRLRRKVMTAPLTAPPASLKPDAPVSAPASGSGSAPWWPVLAALAVAAASFVFLYAH
jgi:hypothetical protein